MGRTRTGSLVLDIDGTLIDSVPNGHLYGVSRTPDCISEWGDYIYFRPHLESFLLYAFSRFEHVAIWTAASPEWAETIMLAFQPMLRRIKRQLNRKRSGSMECDCGAEARRIAMMSGSDESGACDCHLPPTTTDNMFSFVYTKSKCSKKCVPDYESQLLYEYHTKPLRKVWRNKSFQKLGWNPKTTLILEDTPQNCVSNYGNALYIRTYDVTDTRRKDSALLVLQAFLDRIRHVDDVRTIEKRDWERLCASAVKQSPFPAPLKHALSAPSNIGAHFRSTLSSSSSASTSSFSSSYSTLTATSSRIDLPAPVDEDDHDDSFLLRPPTLPSPPSSTGSYEECDEFETTCTPAPKPHPLSKHATTGNLFAAVLTKHLSSTKTTTYTAQLHDYNVASDSDPEYTDRVHYETDFSSSEDLSSSCDSSSDDDLESSDDESLNDRMHLKGMHRSTSLPMTSYCHRMPKMLDFAKLKISHVGNYAQGKGKSDVEDLDV